MRPLIARVATFFVCGVAGCAPDAEPVAFRLTTWNVQNLFNDRRDSDVARETVVTRAAYAAKLAAIARILRTIAADIVVLQEVEHAGVTAELAARVALPYHATSDGNDPRGIDIAVLSRFPIVLTRSHREARLAQGSEGNVVDAFARDCHEVHLAIAGQKLALLGVHLKARADPTSRARRLAEAAKIVDIATDTQREYPAALLAVVGDFNAEPTDPELAPLAAAGLTSVASSLAPGSHTYQGATRLLLDDQRVDARMWRSVERALIEQDAMVAGASDHAPLTVDYYVTE
jgi:endonuclease/exonuclease/phosphatase family metal-dependent hydrolase